VVTPGDRSAPSGIADDGYTIQAGPLAAIKGSFFAKGGREAGSS